MKDEEHWSTQQKVVVGSECPQVVVKESLQVKLKEVAEDDLVGKQPESLRLKCGLCNMPKFRTF